MIRAKNYETVSKFVKVMTKILWPFFPDTVYICIHEFTNFALGLKASLPQRSVHPFSNISLLLLLLLLLSWKSYYR